MVGRTKYNDMNLTLESSWRGFKALCWCQTPFPKFQSHLVKMSGPLGIHSVRSPPGDSNAQTGWRTTASHSFRGGVVAVVESYLCSVFSSLSFSILVPSLYQWGKQLTFLLKVSVFSAFGEPFLGNMAQKIAWWMLGSCGYIYWKKKNVRVIPTAVNHLYIHPWCPSIWGNRCTSSCIQLLSPSASGYYHNLSSSLQAPSATC